MANWIIVLMVCVSWLFVNGLACPLDCKLCSTKVLYCPWANYSTLPENISLDITNLHFPYNFFNTLTNKMFARFVKLEHLVISNNMIEVVEPFALEGLKQLKRLRLSKNSLRSFPWSAFLYTPNISFVFLNDNFIRNIPQAQVFSKLRSLKTLDVSGNRLTCSCNFFGFSGWIHDQSEVFIEHVNILNCSSSLGFLTKKIQGFTANQSKRHFSKCVKLSLKLSFTSFHLTKRTKRGIEESPARKNVTISDPENLTFYRDRIRPVPPYEPVWAMNKTERFIFITGEDVALQISCEIEGVHPIGNGEIVLKTLILKDERPVDLKNETGWSNSSKITIDRVKQELHDGIGIICAAETIAGTAIISTKLRVASSLNHQLETIGEQLIPTAEANEATLKVEESVNVEDVLYDYDPRYHQFQDATSHTSYKTNTTSATAVSPTCRRNSGDAVIMLSASTDDRGCVYFKHSFARSLNVSLTQKRKAAKILITIFSAKSDETIYICHSDDSIPTRWLTVDVGTTTTSLQLQLETNGTVCVLSTSFSTEVCAYFPAASFSDNDMTVMIIVGVNLLVLASLMMVMSASCHLLRDRVSIFVRNPEYRFIQRQSFVSERNDELHCMVVEDRPLELTD